MSINPQQIISDFFNDQDFGIGSLYTKGKAAELIKELDKNGYEIALKDPSGINEYYAAVKRNHKEIEK